MQVRLSGFNIGVMVAFSELGYRAAMNRFGVHDIVLRWPEIQAWASGVEKSSSAEEQHKRLLEGLRFFAGRQKINAVDW